MLLIDSVLEWVYEFVKQYSLMLMILFLLTVLN